MSADAAINRTRRLGTLLVALQFPMLGWLLWQAVAALQAGRRTPDALLALAAGFALGLWAVSANRPGNFNIRPVPRAGGQLISRGPYRWIRHPMYSALLLAGLGAARLSSSSGSWVVLAALAVVLLGKSRIEETSMLAVHAGYADYRRQTRRFIPGLF